MAKKKKSEEKGHEVSRFGFTINTAPVEGGGWLARITPKVKSDSGAPRPAIDKDGFRYEGEAIDWAEDWAQENRPFVVKIEAEDAGFRAQVLDEVGFDQYRTVVCGDAGEARQVAESWIAARRRHDLQVIEARRQARANYRLILDDLLAREEEAEATIEAAKGEIKTVEKERDQAKQNLRDPQITFNFVAELERNRALAGAKTGKDSRQTDIEDKLGGAANDSTSRARGAAGRARGTEAPTPA